jgi:hypothetical protein
LRSSARRHYLAIDLDDYATIALAAQATDADFGHLDILVNNAGIVGQGDGLPSGSSLDAIERAFRVKNSSNASAVAQGSVREHLAYELRDTSIKVNSVDPGYTATDLNHHRGTQTIPEGAAENKVAIITGGSRGLGRNDGFVNDVRRYSLATKTSALSRDLPAATGYGRSGRRSTPSSFQTGGAVWRARSGALKLKVK